MQSAKKFFVSAIAVTVSLIATGVFLPTNVFAQTAVSSTVATTTAVAVATSSNPNAGVAAAVQSYFADIPVMIAIAKCESGPRQFASDGTPLYAGTDDLMVGVFQIDSSIHTAPALALGFDITTLAGNLGYARYLYGAEGTEPWISSFSCWGSAVAPTSATPTSATTAAATVAVATSSDQNIASAPASTPVLTEDLSLGDIDPQVLILQQLLNQAGFTLATSGPGSPGNETTKFGALTYAALKKFQCAQGIACSGDEATTGYGLLNAPTRAALLAATANGDSTASNNATGTIAVAAAVSMMTATTTTTVIAPASNNNDPAEIAELQSRVAALVVIVDQLEAELAAHLGQ